MKSYKADLHIHTCLSPCAELSMSPMAIIEKALKEELNIVGICDHNSAENVPAVSDVAKAKKIFVFPGIEVNTQEEIHLLGLFDNIHQAFSLQEMIYAHLPGENDETAFGLQVVVNKKGEVMRFNPRLLIGACGLSINETVDAIHSLGGLAVASHIDRDSYSIFSQLGFIPPDLALDALEISPLTSIEDARKRFPATLPFTTSSDAHRPEEIGQRFTWFQLEKVSIGEIKKALLNKKGRRLIN